MDGALQLRLGTYQVVGGTPPTYSAHTQRSRHLAGIRDKPHRAAYVQLLVLLNLDKLRRALVDVTPGQHHLLLGIEYDQQERYGRRGIGVATVSVVKEFVRIRYYVRRGLWDQLDEYLIDLDQALSVVEEHIGAHEALNLRRLSDA